MKLKLCQIARPKKKITIVKVNQEYGFFLSCISLYAKIIRKPINVSIPIIDASKKNKYIFIFLTLNH